MKLKIKKIKIRKIKKCSAGFLLCLISHFFITCLVLFVISLIVGAVLFYKYSFLAQKIELEYYSGAFQLREDAYNDVLEIWQKKEQRFQSVETKKYSDPFKGIILNKSEELTE